MVIRPVWVVVQLLCCGDADYCLRPASSLHTDDGIQRHGESDEEATALGTDEAEESEVSAKSIDFVSCIVRRVGQEETQDMGEGWKMVAAGVARYT